MMVHCSSCGAVLRVPPTAAGRRARCPACRNEFIVPPVEDLFEETVSTWIEQDVDQEREQRSEMWDQAAAVQEGQRRTRVRAIDPRPPAGRNPMVPWPSRPNAPRSGAGGAPHPSPDSARPTARLAGSAPVASPVLAPPPAPAAPAATAAPAPALPPQVQSPAPAATVEAAYVAAPSWPAEAEAGIPAFPEELIPSVPRPQLVVRECSQNGVRIAFDARFLEHEGFRASLPMRDVFSRGIERTGLSARPVAFIDRSGATLRSVELFHAKYEQTVMPGWTPLDLLRAMPIMEGLPRPFNLPLPYYVSVGHAQLALDCQTTRRPDGGFTCEVLFPFGEYALEWLARVNGTCGPEYRLLEQELRLIHADAWNQLPEVCRQRIVVWCHFRPRERFVLFIPDAEFPQREMGLAGLVVTSQRLLYQKYHHSGEADLRREALLVVREQEGFYHLTLQDADRHTRVVKIERKDLSALGAALGGAKITLATTGGEVKLGPDSR
jgi:hypothetical protein